MMARTVPTVLDEVVALAGGAAAAYALASPRLAAGMVGVAIATALVPPLAACGLFLARGDLTLARGAFVLYLTNLVAIQAAASLTLWLQGYRRLRQYSRRGVGSALLGPVLSVVLFLGLTGVMAFDFYRLVRSEQFDRQVRTTLTELIASEGDTELVAQRFEMVDGVLRADVTVRSAHDFGYAEVLALQTDLATRLQIPTALRVYAVRSRVLDPFVPPTHTPTPTPTPTPTSTSTPSPTPSPTALSSLTAPPTEFPEATTPSSGPPGATRPLP